MQDHFALLPALFSDLESVNGGFAVHGTKVNLLPVTMKKVYNMVLSLAIVDINSLIYRLKFYSSSRQEMIVD